MGSQGVDSLMSKVVDLEQKMREKWAATGEVQFVACGCGADCGLFPLVCFDASGPFIIALICPACDNTLEVSYGRFALPVKVNENTTSSTPPVANDTGSLQKKLEGVIEEPSLES